MVKITWFFFFFFCKNNSWTGYKKYFELKMKVYEDFFPFLGLIFENNDQKVPSLKVTALSIFSKFLSWQQP